MLKKRREVVHEIDAHFNNMSKIYIIFTKTSSAPPNVNLAIYYIAQIMAYAYPTLLSDTWLNG